MAAEPPNGAAPAPDIGAAVSGGGACAEMHRDSSIVIVDHSDELEACTEHFKVLAKHRDPDVLGVLIDSDGSIGHRYRQRLVELVGDDQAYVMRTLTKHAVAAALRNQLHRSGRGSGGSGLLTEEHCDRAIRSMASWPFGRIDLTQPMLIRVWEMRNNLTPYDAT